jgi:hypothetical protein
VNGYVLSKGLSQPDVLIQEQETIGIVPVFWKDERIDGNSISMIQAE